MSKKTYEWNFLRNEVFEKDYGYAITRIGVCYTWLCCHLLLVDQWQNIH